jgi:hypothetical protein
MGRYGNDTAKHPHRTTDSTPAPFHLILLTQQLQLILRFVPSSNPRDTRDDNLC